MHYSKIIVFSLTGFGFLMNDNHLNQLIKELLTKSNKTEECQIRRKWDSKAGFFVWKLGQEEKTPSSELSARHWRIREEYSSGFQRRPQKFEEIPQLIWRLTY